MRDQPGHGPTGPASTGRRCPGPARCWAWSARCCSRPEDLALVKGDPPSAGASSTTCWSSARRGSPGCGPTTTGCSSSATRCSRPPGWPRRQGRSAESALSTLGVWDAHLARTGAELLAARLDLVDDAAAATSARRTRRWPRGATPDRRDDGLPAVLRAAAGRRVARPGRPGGGPARRGRAPPQRRDRPRDHAWSGRTATT